MVDGTAVGEYDKKLGGSFISTVEPGEHRISGCTRFFGRKKNMSSMPILETQTWAQRNCVLVNRTCCVGKKATMEVVAVYRKHSQGSTTLAVAFLF